MENGIASKKMSSSWFLYTSRSGCICSEGFSPAVTAKRDAKTQQPSSRTLEILSIFTAPLNSLFRSKRFDVKRLYFGVGGSGGLEVPALRTRVLCELTWPPPRLKLLPKSKILRTPLLRDKNGLLKVLNSANASNETVRLLPRKRSRPSCLHDTCSFALPLTLLEREAR